MAVIGFFLSNFVGLAIFWIVCKCQENKIVKNIDCSKKEEKETVSPKVFKSFVSTCSNKCYKCEVSKSKKTKNLPIKKNSK